MPARALLEIMSTIKDLARPGRQFRFAPPVILNSPGAFVPDDRRTQIRAREFRRCRRGTFDRVVEGDVDRLEREIGAVEVKHGAEFPSLQIPISSLNSSGVIKGPPAAALAWRATMRALDLRVMPFSL